MPFILQYQNNIYKFLQFNCNSLSRNLSTDLAKHRSTIKALQLIHHQIQNGLSSRGTVMVVSKEFDTDKVVSPWKKSFNLLLQGGSSITYKTGRWTLMFAALNPRILTKNRVFSKELPFYRSFSIDILPDDYVSLAKWNHIPHLRIILNQCQKAVPLWSKEQKLCSSGREYKWQR